MTKKRWAEKITLVGSGAALSAGATAAAVSGIGIFNVPVTSSIIALSGVGGFVVGLVLSYYAEEKILRNVASNANQPEERIPPHLIEQMADHRANTSQGSKGFPQPVPTTQQGETGALITTQPSVFGSVPKASARQREQGL